MLLRRVHPAQTFGDLTREMNRVFGGVLPDFDSAIRRTGRVPAINAWEDNEVYFVEAELPGMRMEDIQVEVLGDEVHLKGVRETKIDENAAFHRRERGYGEFERTLTLPTEVDVDQVEATLKNGVLTVKLPKAEAAKPRKIEVKV